MKELREMIRDLREDNDLKQKEVANYLNVSQQTYSNYENGRREIPTWVVTSLAKLYKVSTDYLLGSDSSYVGNTSLNNPYLKNITMHDVMYDMQKLKPAGRRELVNFLQYLRDNEKREAERLKDMKQ